MPYPFVLLASLAGISILVFMVAFSKYHRQSSKTFRNQLHPKGTRRLKPSPDNVLKAAPEGQKSEKKTPEKMKPEMKKPEKVAKEDGDLRRLLNKTRFDLMIALDSKKVYEERSKKKKEECDRLKSSLSRLKLHAASLKYWYDKACGHYKEQFDMSQLLRNDIQELLAHSDEVFNAYDELFNQNVKLQMKLVTYAEEVHHLQEELQTAQTQTKKANTKLMTTVEQLCDLDEENKEYKRVLERMWREKLDIEKRVQDLEDLMIHPEATTPKQESFGLGITGSDDGTDDTESEGEMEEISGNQMAHKREEETGPRKAMNLAEELAGFESGDESDD